MDSHRVSQKTLAAQPQSTDELRFSWGVRLIPILVFAGAAVFASACDVATDPSTETTEVVDVAPGTIALVDNLAGAHSPTDPTGVVCDPFTNNPTNPGSNLQLGIVGSLYYMAGDVLNTCRTPPAGDETCYWISNYKTLGTKAPVSLFLNDINVPTRYFDTPFLTQSGDTLTDSQGNAFYEYFSVSMDSEVRLADSDNEGLYQFAILSDDGSLLQVDDTGTGLHTLINNDFHHQTKLAVATTPVVMTRASRMPMHLDYFQGPRRHIAMILMWREWNGSATELENGKSGNGYFFDYTTTPSTPKSTYNGMLSRGWKALNPGNFGLPAAVAANPCKQPDPVTTQIQTYTPDASLTNNPAVTFTFNSNYAGATFDCSLDGAAAAACTSPVTYSGLADGAHTFEVHASQSGIRDATGASHSWRIDIVPPLLTFVSTNTTKTSIQIDWTTSEPTSAWVEWGTTVDATNLVPETSTYDAQHTVLLSNLTPITVYYFYLNGHDQAGNAFRSNRFSSATRR